MDFQLALLAVIIVLLVIVGVQRTVLIITRRAAQSLRKNIEKEREASADILKLSKNVISTGITDEEFLALFAEYALRTLRGNGAAVLKAVDGGFFRGCSISGTFPPLREVTTQVEQQLMAHPRKHTESFKNLTTRFTDADIDEVCGEKGFAYYRNQAPVWFPQKFLSEAPICLIAPVKVGGGSLACVIVTSKDEFDSYRLTEDDGRHLVRLNELASLSLEVLKVFRERKEYEEKIRAAREEGMMQVSTGIIHNIGNAITVAKLSVLGLKEKLDIRKEERPETLVLEEILPAIRKNLESGTLQDFLASDPSGSQYMEIMAEIINHIDSRSDDVARQLDSLGSKLFHISEIIELQQRFVGELGTENMVHLSSVIGSSVKIFEETFNKRGVGINTEIDQGVPEVLIDASMMTQVFMNFIKNAVEAMDSESDPAKSYKLDIRLTREDGEKETFAVVEIADNGPGIPDDIKDKVFNFGFSTKRGGAKGRGFGLHSCVETVRKYGGRITVDSVVKEGTSFKIFLPARKEAEPAANGKS